ncbi:MAG: hypothetical protein GX352_03065 [Clostridiales bacterium]|nr:hypothetical protein [Clostridiales bacterium]
MATESTIRFDVNPAIELKINRFEKVLSTIALNEDADIILDGMNLKNTDLNIAVNALIGSMVKNGYISEIKNSILISVDSSNKKKEIRLQEQLLDEVNDLLTAYSVRGAVLSQTVEEDSRLLGLAKEHNISLGKAALIDVLVSQDETLNFADIAPLSVNDINLLIASRQLDLRGIEKRGQANSTAYIGEEAAKNIALTHAGIEEDSAVFTEVKLDYEKGKMVYEIEFYSGNIEYEYEVDAVTGNIIKMERENKKHIYGSQKTQGKQEEHKDQSGSNSYIGEAEAKRIALKHAGVPEKSAVRLEIEKEYEKGRLRYDIEFTVGNTKYEYDIDAVTGDIIEAEQKTKKTTSAKSSSSSTNTGTKSSNTNNKSTNTVSKSQEASAKPADTGSKTVDTGDSRTKEYIGTKKAETIALKDAGLSRDSVRKLEIEMEKEKGRMIYEVEFKYNGYEYGYEIDACTGKILSVEKERD